jgi:hypothetical protein
MISLSGCNAFDRGGVDETECRPASAALRLADMDRDGGEAQVTFEPVGLRLVMAESGLGWLPWIF